MKKFNIGIILCVLAQLTCSGISSDSLLFFSQATQQIVTSNEYRNFVEVSPDRYTVSCILFPYDLYTRGFKKDIEKFAAFEEERTYNISLFDDGYNEDLKHLGTKRKSKNIILFSKIRNGIFFGQVIQFGKKMNTNANVPSFGIGLLYMFHISDSQNTSIIATSEVHYN